jgi:hypothetical protein
MPPIDTPWLDLKEAAAYVRRSPKYWSKLTLAGKTPGIKQGKGKTAEWRFNRAALDKFIERGGVMTGGAQR